MRQIPRRFTLVKGRCWTPDRAWQAAYRGTGVVGGGMILFRALFDGGQYKYLANTRSIVRASSRWHQLLCRKGRSSVVDDGLLQCQFFAVS